MASWVRLRDRHNPRSRPIVFFNTHFDHRGEKARRVGTSPAPLLRLPVVIENHHWRFQRRGG
jgi:hypothetical protein